MPTDPAITEYLSAKGALWPREAVLCTVAWLQDAERRPVVLPAEVTAHYPRRHMPTLPRVRSMADAMRALAEAGLLERVEGLACDCLTYDDATHDRLTHGGPAGRPARSGAGDVGPASGIRVRTRVGRVGQAGYRLTVLGRRAVSALPDRERHAAVMRSVISRVRIPRPEGWTPRREPDGLRDRSPRWSGRR